MVCVQPAMYFYGTYREVFRLPALIIVAFRRGLLTKKFRFLQQKRYNSYEFHHKKGKPNERKHWRCSQPC